MLPGLRLSLTCLFLNAMFLLCLAAPTHSLADPSAFGSAYLPPDPAWQATQGAFAATSGGASAAWANPGGLIQPGGSQLALSHLAWGGGLGREWVGGLWQFRSDAAAAFDASVLHSAPMQGFDAEGRETGEFQASEWSAGVGGAIALGSRWAVGLSSRYHRLEDPSSPAASIGFGAGLLFRGDRLSLGMGVTDLGAPLRGEWGTWNLPTRWRAGLERSALRGRWSLAACAVGNRDGFESALFGLRLRPASWCRILGGVSTASNGSGEAAWSAGGEVEHGRITVGYAYHPAGLLGTSHQFGIRLNLEAFAAGPRSPLSAGFGLNPPVPPAGSSGRETRATTTALPSGGFAVLGGTYRSAAAAASEMNLLRALGLVEPRLIETGDGRVRILVSTARDQVEAETQAEALRARAFLVSIEPWAHPTESP